MKITKNYFIKNNIKTIKPVKIYGTIKSGNKGQ